VGGGGDDEAAFAAGLDENLDLLAGLRGECFLGGGPAGELHVGEDVAAGDAVDEVVAAGRGEFAVAVLDALPHGAEPGRFGDLVELLVASFGDGTAFELEHLQPAGDGAEDDAKPGVAVVEPAADGVFGGALGLVLLPGPVRPLRAVDGSPGDAGACVVPGEGRVDGAVVGAHVCLLAD
jgi:hypothetical protein